MLYDNFLIYLDVINIFFCLVNQHATNAAVQLMIALSAALSGTLEKSLNKFNIIELSIISTIMVEANSGEMW